VVTAVPADAPARPGALLADAEGCATLGLTPDSVVVLLSTEQARPGRPAAQVVAGLVTAPGPAATSGLAHPGEPHRPQGARRRSRQPVTIVQGAGALRPLPTADVFAEAGGRPV
jgi:hypothetical protein